MGMKSRRPSNEKETIEIDGVEFDKEALIEEVEESLEELLEERLKDGDTFETYEKTLLDVVHGIVRRKLEKKLQTMADGLADRLWIDHNNPAWPLELEGCEKLQYRRHAPGTVSYHSLVGPLRVRRATYRQCNQRRGVCVPLELEAGLMERMTPAMAKSVAIGYAFMPPRQFEEFMCASRLQPPSRSTLDRLGRDVGSYAATVCDDIEPAVRANEVIPPDARSVSLGLDRTAVPMRSGERRIADCLSNRETRRTRPKPEKQAQIRGPVRWRMDYVGTVSLVDESGHQLVTRKYRLPAHQNPRIILDRMMADVRRALTQRPLEVSVVQDGAPELWKEVAKALKREELVADWTEVLDWYHLDERLSRCLDLCATARTREAQRKRWHTRLLEQERGMNAVLRSLRRSARLIEPTLAKQLQVHIRYLAHNKRRAAYASYRRRGIPIGSGATEGACKSVIGARAKRSGQRWSQRGLTAALHLRSVHQSERFDSFWSFFRQYYRARVIVPTQACV